MLKLLFPGGSFQAPPSLSLYILPLDSTFRYAAVYLLLAEQEYEQRRYEGYYDSRAYHIILVSQRSCKGVKRGRHRQVKELIWRYFMSYWNNRRICSSNEGLPPLIKRRMYYDSEMGLLRVNKIKLYYMMLGSKAPSLIEAPQ